MAKHKLLASHRMTLNNYVSSHIKPIKECDALKEAYDVALSFVLPYVVKKWPQDTMDILDKYGVAEKVYNVRLQFPNSDVKNFDFHSELTILKPKWYGRGEQIFLVNNGTAGAVEAWLSAEEALHLETAKRQDAYRALISGSTYLEDLHKLWPESQTIVPIVGELIPLGPDQMDIIKCDLKERGLDNQPGN